MRFAINATVRALPEIADQAIPTVIQWAKQHQIEFPCPGVLEHLLEVWPSRVSAGFVVHVFANDLPSLLAAVLPERDQLVLRVLPLVFGRNASIESYFLDFRIVAHATHDCIIKCTM